MAYGRETFGQQPYGGTGFDETGPALVSTSPAAGQRNVPLNAPVSIVLTSGAGLDPWSLYVDLEGHQAIAGGTFRPGYAGTITFDGNDCNIAITTHPDFIDSTWVSLQIWVQDLAAVQGEWVLDFNAVILAQIAETVTESEAVATQQTQQLPVAETVTESEAVTTQQTQSANVSESVSVSEAEATLYNARPNANETVSIVETLSSQQEQGLAVAETVTEAESVTLVIGALRNVAEGVSVSDAVDTQVGFRPTPSETVTTAESVTTTQEQSVAVAETSTVVESVAILRTSYADVAETVAQVEAASALFGGHPTPAETVPVTEALVERYGATANLDESVAVSENIDIKIEIILHEHVPVFEFNTAIFDGSVNLPETVPLSESGVASVGVVRSVSETVAVSEAVTGDSAACPHVFEVVRIEESLTVGHEGISPSDRRLRVRFQSPVLLDGLANPDNFRIVALGHSYPILVESAEPFGTTVATGAGGSTLGDHGKLTWTLNLPTPPAVGNYVIIPGEDRPLLVLGVAGSTVTIDPPILGRSALFAWTEMAYDGVLLTTTKASDDLPYRLDIANVWYSDGSPASDSQEYTSIANKPHLVATNILDDGQVLLTFSEPMRSDSELTSTAEYTITGPTPVAVVGVDPVSPTQVVLRTLGLTASVDPYSIQVRATGTPKDIAGNPIDPVYNVAEFSGVNPLMSRSIYTDHGPIAKPPLTIQSGINATVVSFTLVGLPGVTLSPDLVGRYLTISGGTNGGTYRIMGTVASTGILDPPKVRIQASLTVPDPDSGTLTWEIFDPRDGQIADDPSDVVVRVNGTPVTPEAVLGLLGQVVLNARPAPADDVKVDYSWVLNPTVEVRRLNSREFRLNNWNRDAGLPHDASGHKYRFNNVLTTPALYVPEDVQAWLQQPQQRDLKYRAYERAYTAVLNDPNLLLLNSPTQRIAFPPLQRTVLSSFVTYDALTLPEAASTDPWERKGTGSASVSGGELIVQDASSGPFPGGEPVFWVRPMDVTFPHVFASTWRLRITADPVTEGVFTGVATGYSSDNKAMLLGYLDDGGVRKLGVLKKGSGNNPQPLSAWGGGYTSLGPTGAPIEFDWSITHSYRIFRDRDGWVKVYVDGGVLEVLRVHEDDLPFLAELQDPFNVLEGVFFGSLSRPATNTSRWTFVRYEILPTNPYQTAPSVFANYEGTMPPENMPVEPWTPIGYHGTETILNNCLILDSTSATDAATESIVGLIDGDFRGFIRLEPLLNIASEVVLDVGFAVQTFTSGITPNAMTAAIDDGDRLIQVSFLSDKAAPKLSYGGRSFPDEWTPVPWLKSLAGTVTATMIGRTLQISDVTDNSGLVYYTDDSAPVGDPARVFDPGGEYAFETRATVVSYSPDPSGFCGATVDVYDSNVTVGIMLEEISGVRYVTLHSDGVPVAGGRFAFNWFDGKAHTYRATKRGSPSVVSLFVDGVYIGSVNYSLFTGPTPNPTGVLSFGSAPWATSPPISMSKSVVEWVYCNGWQMPTSHRKYVGIWRGIDPNSLTGYHLPTKITGRQAMVAANSLGDALADFTVAGVVPGDLLVIDVGPNKGTYEIAAVPNPNTLTILGVWPSGPTQVDYRIVQETDWTTQHKYRVVKDPGGSVALLFDTQVDPLIRLSYDSTTLPPSSAGLFRSIAGGLPSIAFGAFDPTNLSQTSWDFVRFGIVRTQTGMRIVPHHEILNQRNVMASPEHILTTIPHAHTDYWASSTGIPAKVDPDFLQNSGLIAFTLLNEGTPLMPLTQTAETHAGHDLVPVLEPHSGMNRPEDLLNTSRGFVLNDATASWKLNIPNNVLYNSLDVIEKTTGEEDLITPFCDGWPNLGTIEYQNRTCLRYEANVIPELDTTAPTPWALSADDLSKVSRSTFAGVLTYGTNAAGTRTAYRNQTPLPDAPGLQTETRFRLKLLSDSSGGLGDTQVRFGLSAPGMTMALGFLTTPIGERYVVVKDLVSGNVVGATPFDFGDGAYHTYRIVRDVGQGVVQVFVDS